MNRPPIEELKKQAFTAECEIGNYMRILPNEVTELCNYALALESQLSATIKRAETKEQACRKALEKQVPQKPSIEDEMGYFMCPNCNAAINYTSDREDHKFCLNCGQKLDWN